MTKSSDNNKRIAKNTLFLYARMLLVMAVALYTSRVVLEALGVDDYGIYNVVGGVSSSFIFFSSALSTSTQRYLNFELGRGKLSRVNEVFNTFLILYVFLAGIVIIIGFLFGHWFVSNKLVIPIFQKHNALIVLYTSVISLASVFIFSVYESVLIARENMRLYAYLGIIDILMKLGVAYLIMIVPNRLVYYAWFMMVVQIVPKLLMTYFCIKKYPEVRHRFYWNKNLFKEIFGFSGWNIYGSAVWMINGQGISVLLNMFFGPVVNAANGIAQQVNSAINNFGNNFFTAVRPQIIKRYSSGEIDSFINLIHSSTRFSVYLLWILSLPIIIRISQILNLWLVEVPMNTSIFVQWILVYSIINSLNNPVWTGLMATGSIKKTVLIGSNLFLLAFPFAYIALKLGSAPWSVFPFLCLGRLLFLIVTINNLKIKIGIHRLGYIKNSILPAIMVILVSLVLSLSLNVMLPINFWGLITFCLLSVLTTGYTVFLIGLKKSEKNTLQIFIKSKIKR